LIILIMLGEEYKLLSSSIYQQKLCSGQWLKVNKIIVSSTDMPNYTKYKFYLFPAGRDTHIFLNIC
jgi:hypothetical protein